jgi:hypothetical protein
MDLLFNNSIYVYTYIYIIDIYKIKIMPRKNTMRDNVNAVRSRLPNLSNLSREKIELALLYYESNVDETVEAFNKSRIEYFYI